MFGRKVKILFKQVWSDRSAATAIEYGLLMALMAIAIVASIELVGSNTADKFDHVVEEWDKAAASQ